LLCGPCRQESNIKVEETHAPRIVIRRAWLNSAKGEFEVLHDATRLGADRSQTQRACTHGGCAESPQLTSYRASRSMPIALLLDARRAATPSGTFGTRTGGWRAGTRNGSEPPTSSPLVGTSTEKFPWLSRFATRRRQSCSDCTQNTTGATWLPFRSNASSLAASQGISRVSPPIICSCTRTRKPSSKTDGRGASVPADGCHSAARISALRCSLTSQKKLCAPCCARAAAARAARASRDAKTGSAAVAGRGEPETAIAPVS
jgi:hypothetical protein